MKVLEYLDAQGRSPFGRWFLELNPQAAAKVTIVLVRIEQNNLSNVKSVGGGVFEYKLDFGPGYRIYFGREGEEFVILLAGGTKQRQQADIKAAQLRWQNHKLRKREQSTWH